MLALAIGFHGEALAKHKKKSAQSSESTQAEHQQHAEPPRQQGGISRDRAIADAEKRHRAQVLRAEDSVVDGRRVYVLRLMSKTEGRVWTVRVDAESGKEL